MDIRPLDMPRWSQSIFIAASTVDLYALVSDVTRMGEWSPVCRSCQWDEGQGPEVGSWFTGHNVDDGREWDTHCEVVVADPGREFAFVVAGKLVRWSFGFATSARKRWSSSTSMRSSWRILPR